MNTLTLDLRPTSASTSRNTTIARAARTAGNPTLRAVLGGATLAVVGSSFTNAEAQEVDIATPLKTIAKPVCQVYNAFTGVLGIGFLLCLLVFAGLKYASGNSKATSQAIAAVIGAIIVFSARTALNMADASNGGSFSTACKATPDPTKGL